MPKIFELFNNKKLGKYEVYERDETDENAEILLTNFPKNYFRERKDVPDPETYKPDEGITLVETKKPVPESKSSLEPTEEEKAEEDAEPEVSAIPDDDEPIAKSETIDLTTANKAEKLKFCKDNGIDAKYRDDVETLDKKIKAFLA